MSGKNRKQNQQQSSNVSTPTTPDTKSEPIIANVSAPIPMQPLTMSSASVVGPSTVLAPANPQPLVMGDSASSPSLVKPKEKPIDHVKIMQDQFPDFPIDPEALLFLDDLDKAVQVQYMTMIIKILKPIAKEAARIKEELKDPQAPLEVTLAIATHAIGFFKDASIKDIHHAASKKELKVTGDFMARLKAKSSVPVQDKPVVATPVLKQGDVENKDTSSSSSSSKTTDVKSFYAKLEADAKLKVDQVNQEKRRKQLERTAAVSGDADRTPVVYTDEAERTSGGAGTSAKF